MRAGNQRRLHHRRTGWLLAAVAAAAAALLGLTGMETWRERPVWAQDARRGQAVRIRGEDGRAVDLYRGSYALLIGVSRYTAGWAPLESVPGELQQVRKELEAQGFTVEEVQNPTGEQIRDAVEGFIGRYGFQRDNRLLVFYSGHGYSRLEGRKGYLVPADTPLPERDEVGFLRQAVEMEQIVTWARRIEAKHALFLFDSCFSGMVFKSKDRPVPRRISLVTAQPVRQFISAGGAGESVPARSVFTPSFLRGIGGEADLDKDGYVTGTELGVYLQGKVADYNTGQFPQYGKIKDPELDEGDFVFAVPASAGDPAGPDGLAAERAALTELEKMKSGVGSIQAPGGAPALTREELARQSYLLAEKVNTEEAWRKVSNAFSGTNWGDLAGRQAAALAMARQAAEAEAAREREQELVRLAEESRKTMLSAWASAQRADTAAAYRSFLAVYGADPLASAEADQARQRLAVLERAAAIPAPAAPPAQHQPSPLVKPV